MPKETRRLGVGAAGVAALIGLGGAEAQAAALERVAPSSRVLFEEGRYLEFSLGYVRPSVGGSGGGVPDALLPPGVPGPVPILGDTGNVFDDFFQIGAAYKADITDRTSFALILDQPVGANTYYGTGDYTGLFTYDGTLAKVRSHQITGILAHDVTPSVKLWAGLRAMRVKADVAIPFVAAPGLGGYTLDAGTDTGYGYLLGAAYQRPDIALRVALTYSSEVDLTFDGTEFGAVASQTGVSIPQSVTLEFQTGIAEDTLLFGSVHWMEWAGFEINPPNYPLGTLVEYEKDWWTYTLGLGRRLTDTLSGSLALTYEPSTDRVLTTLGPVDGRTMATAALSYDMSPITLSGSVTYGRLGSASNVLQTDFSGNDIFAVGLRVGYSF